MNLDSIKRILITRTDRIGDVILSIPTITATRKAFPESYIAVMVAPITKELIEGNTDIDEIIVLDKNIGPIGNLKFINEIRKKKFDLALILHTTKRVNIITFLASIPNRVGYKRNKFDFLLTHKLEYAKRLGEKHESEYTLDILRSLGIDAKNSNAFIAINKETETKVDNLLKGIGLIEGVKFAVLHPTASSKARMWPSENFAKLADILIDRFRLKVLFISGPEQAGIVDKVMSLMKNRSCSLCGKTSLKELAAIFKKASLCISNISGPVHIASVMGCPSISIFSGNDKGLSPVRWKQFGNNARFMHKDVGCKPCLAHNCKNDFLCLRSITVEEMIDVVEDILK